MEQIDAIVKNDHCIINTFVRLVKYIITLIIYTIESFLYKCLRQLLIIDTFVVSWSSFENNKYCQIKLYELLHSKTLTYFLILVNLLWMYLTTCITWHKKFVLVEKLGLFECIQTLQSNSLNSVLGQHTMLILYKIANTVSVTRFYVSIWDCCKLQDVLFEIVYFCIYASNCIISTLFRLTFQMLYFIASEYATALILVDSGCYILCQSWQHQQLK